MLILTHTYTYMHMPYTYRNLPLASKHEKMFNLIRETQTKTTIHTLLQLSPACDPSYLGDGEVQIQGLPGLQMSSRPALQLSETFLSKTWGVGGVGKKKGIRSGI